jgi:excisionase family DNA binding protein
MAPLDIFPRADEVVADTGGRRAAGDSVRLVLTIDEAAERLGIGQTLMSALVRSGEVESVRIGRLRRIPTECLEEYVQRLRRARRGNPAA